MLTRREFEQHARFTMSTVKEIVAAARHLRADQLLQLRRQLDRLEKELWAKELARTSNALKRRKISDETIDRLVMRRRRENRR